MSVCSKYFSCLHGDPDWKEVLKALSIMDSNGNKFINICYNDRGACTDGRGNATYESAFECLVDASFSDVLELIVGEDECGNPNINVLANICDECTSQEDEQGGIPGPL